MFTLLSRFEVILRWDDWLVEFDLESGPTSGGIPDP